MTLLIIQSWLINLTPPNIIKDNQWLISPYQTLISGGGGGFLLEVQYSILKSLISTCVLSYVGSREDWLLDRICES